MIDNKEYNEIMAKLNSLDIRITKIETSIRFYSMIIPTLMLILGSIIGIIIGHFI